MDAHLRKFAQSFRVNRRWSEPHTSTVVINTTQTSMAKVL